MSQRNPEQTPVYMIDLLIHVLPLFARHLLVDFAHNNVYVISDYSTGKRALAKIHGHKTGDNSVTIEITFCEDRKEEE